MRFNKLQLIKLKLLGGSSSALINILEKEEVFSTYE